MDAFCNRIILARECVAILHLQQREVALSRFVAILGGKITDVTNSLAITTQSCSKRREKMWALFYEFRSSTLTTLWKDLLVQLNIPSKYNDPWLVQTASRIALEKYISIKYSLPSASSSTDPMHLTVDEHNALRYAAGYVLLSIKRKNSFDNPSLVAWIEKQTDVSGAVNGVSYSQFTKMWIEKVNRGGLLLVSDNMYHVFHAIEMVLRQFLKGMTENHGLEKDKVTNVIYDDNEVQYFWSIMSIIDIDEESSERLLKDIIRLWITVRGFSYASSIVEDYKRSCGALKRKKSLRKELKKQNSNTAEL